MSVSHVSLLASSRHVFNEGGIKCGQEKIVQLGEHQQAKSYVYQSICPPADVLSARWEGNSPRECNQK